MKPPQGRRAPRQVPQEREHRGFARADAELAVGLLLISGDLREAEIRPEAARQRETARRVAHRRPHLVQDSLGERARFVIRNEV